MPDRFDEETRELMPDCGVCKGSGNSSDGRCANCDALGVIVLTRTELADALRATAKRERAEERERCARIADEMVHNLGGDLQSMIAKRIRSDRSDAAPKQEQRDEVLARLKELPKVDVTALASTNPSQLVAERDAALAEAAATKAAAATLREQRDEWERLRIDALAGWERASIMLGMAEKQREEIRADFQQASADAARLRAKLAAGTSDALVDTHKKLDAAQEEVERLRQVIKNRCRCCADNIYPDPEPLV